MSKGSALWLLCILLLGSGCSSQKVVLNSYYLSATERHKLTEKLQQQGYQVVDSLAAFPKSIDESTLVYSLMLSDNQQVEQLSRLFTQWHWPITQLQPLSRGNQWYTGDTIGVYLLPQGVQQRLLKDIQQRYQASQCDVSQQLALQPNGRFILFAASGTNKALLQGHWQWVAGQYVVLTMADNQAWPMYYRLSRSEQVDQISAITMLELVPLNHYPQMHDCHWQYGLRD